MVNTVRATPAEQSHVVELTASKNDAMRVRLTAKFEFVRVELSPTFDVVAVVLRARDPEVRVGTGESEALAPFALVETRLAPPGKSASSSSGRFVRRIR